MDKDLWFDLEIGDEIKVGDRCCGRDHKWFITKPEHLEFSDVVTEASYPTQRKASKITSN